MNVTRQLSTDADIARSVVPSTRGGINIDHRLPSQQKEIHCGTVSCNKCLIGIAIFYKSLLWKYFFLTLAKTLHP